MDSIQWAKVVAWAATVLCVYLSARSAAVFAKNSPRVFTILALFSLNWALLIPFYSVADPSLLLPGFAGFLLVYIGVLLRREAKSPLKVDQEELTDAGNGISTDVPKASPSSQNGSAVDRKDRIALWLLLFLVAPSLISFPPDTVRIDHSKTEIVISSVVTYVGYFSVVSAIRTYSGRKWSWRLMIAIVILYAFVDASFTAHFLTSGKLELKCTPDYWRCPPIVMGNGFLYSFAGFKVIFSTLFIYLVLAESLSNEDRNLSLFDKVLKFIRV